MAKTVGLDVSLDVFAAGLVSCAIGMYLWSLGGWRWSVSTGLLLLTAIDVVVIAEYNQYKGFDGFGDKVHTWACYALFTLVGLTSILVAPDLKRIGPKYYWLSLSFAAVWLIGGPIYMVVVPTSIDGGAPILFRVNT